MNRKFYKKQKKNYIAVIGIEKSLIKKHYDFLTVKQNGSTLFCYGEYQPTKNSRTYKFRIKYSPPNRPVITIIDPKIEYNDDIHMYPSDNSLCLYHKTDLVWNTDYHLFDTIIPWTLEWFVFYELYLITGKWEHPYIPHITKKE